MYEILKAVQVEKILCNDTFITYDFKFPLAVKKVLFTFQKRTIKKKF